MTAERTSTQYPSSDSVPAAQMINLGELPDDAANGSVVGAPMAYAKNPLHAVRARLQVCVGGIEISVGELLAAKESEVLILDREVDQPVDLLLEGSVIARGALVAVDGHFAVRISELATPLGS